MNDYELSRLLYFQALAKELDDLRKKGLKAVNGGLLPSKRKASKRFLRRYRYKHPNPEGGHPSKKQKKERVS